MRSVSRQLPCQVELGFRIRCRHGECLPHDLKASGMVALEGKGEKVTRGHQTTTGHHSKLVVLAKPPHALRLAPTAVSGRTWLPDPVSAWRVPASRSQGTRHGRPGGRNAETPSWP